MSHNRKQKSQKKRGFEAKRSIANYFHAVSIGLALFPLSFIGSTFSDAVATNSPLEAMISISDKCLFMMVGMFVCLMLSEKSRTAAMDKFDEIEFSSR